MLRQLSKRLHDTAEPVQMWIVSVAKMTIQQLYINPAGAWSNVIRRLFFFLKTTGYSSRLPLRLASGDCITGSKVKGTKRLGGAKRKN